MNSESINIKAARSVKWSVLMEVVSRTAQPIIFVILARLLSPNDFGVLAIAMIAISFSQMLWDAGLSKALIQTKKAPEKAAHVVFWTNLVLGIIIYIILFIASPSIALFFKSPSSGNILRVLGLQIIIASFSSVQQALFVRALDFRMLFWIRLSTAFIPGLLSIPLAMLGHGIWALVAGILAGQVMNLWLLWQKSPWRPKFSFDTDIARILFGFGFWVLLESFGAWLIVWGDNLIIGRFLGVHDLGVYRTGWMLVTIIFGLILNPFLPIIYSTFSQMQDDLPALKATFRMVNRVIMALSLPMGVGLLIIGPEIATVLFGVKWQGLGFVLSVIGFMFGMGWLVGINPDIYRAMRKPDVNAKLMFITILYYLPAYYIASQFDLKVFIITRLAISLVALPIHIYLCMRLLSVSPFYLWHEGKYIILATLFMGIIVGLLKIVVIFIMPSLQSFMILLILIMTGIFVYIGSLWILDRSFIMKLKGQFMRAAQC